MIADGRNSDKPEPVKGEVITRQDISLVEDIIGTLPYKSIDDDVKSRCVKAMLDIVENPDEKTTTKIQAVGVIERMEKHNLAFRMAQDGRIPRAYLTQYKPEKAHDCRDTLTTEQLRDFLIAVIDRVGTARQIGP